MQEIITTTLENIPSYKKPLPWRKFWDQVAEKSLFLLSLLPLVLVFVIILALLLRAQPILVTKSFWSLITGQVWKPLKGEFGFLPFITSTAWVTGMAMILAAPPSLLTAIYLAEYASPTIRSFMKPLLDLLAAIPSVVYGIWGVLAIVPLVQNHLAPFLEDRFGFMSLFKSQNPTGYGIFSGGVVLGVMIVPFIISITFEVLSTVPDGFREASLALGATRWQMVKSAVIPQVIPGILAGIVLGASRALGETMAVMMVVGNVVQIPASIFDAAYPLPALIANNYGEMLSIPLYDAALLGAALMLLLIVLFFNILSTIVLHKLKRKN